MKVVIITGMSGAGRSRAADWLEDQGYYCVDNMPPALIDRFLEMTAADTNRIDKVAFVTDLRGRSFFDQLSKVIDDLRKRKGIDLTVLYMEAAPKEIVRRYNEVRRNHPLSGAEASLEVIEEEIFYLAFNMTRFRSGAFVQAVELDGDMIFVGLVDNRPQGFAKCHVITQPSRVRIV